MRSLVRSLCARLCRFRPWDGLSYVDLVLKRWAASRALPYFEHLEQVRQWEWLPRQILPVHLVHPD
jgi:hypothetical protein